jgi:hypothetical protein
VRREVAALERLEQVCRDWARGADDLTSAALLDLARNYREAITQADVTRPRPHP